MAPSLSDATGDSAASCGSRFQLAVFMTCQMPFRFGLPSRRAGCGAACATLAPASRIAASAAILKDLIIPLFPLVR